MLVSFKEGNLANYFLLYQQFAPKTMSLIVKKQEMSLYFCLYPNYINFKIYKNRTKRLIKCDLEENEIT